MGCEKTAAKAQKSKIVQRRIKNGKHNNLVIKFHIGNLGERERECEGERERREIERGHLHSEK